METAAAVHPMNATTIWLIFFLVMIFLEMVTPSFGLSLVGIGGVVAAIFANLGFDFTIQVASFVVSTVLMLGLLRPKIMKKLHSHAHVPSRTEALRGETGEVTQAIQPGSATGRITVNGQDWAATSDVDIPEGTRVKVTGADGIVLKVTR